MPPPIGCYFLIIGRKFQISVCVMAVLLWLYALGAAGSHPASNGGLRPVSHPVPPNYILGRLLAPLLPSPGKSTALGH